MLSSLRRRDPEREIFALCHDGVAERGVALLRDPRLTVLRPAALLAFEPRVGAAQDRNLWAWYATQKPLLPRYVFDSRPDVQALTYVDADAAWFSSPDEVYAEIGDASIALSPHRFPKSADLSHLYGRFNAGFMHWRNDASAQRCLSDWTEACLAWCEPRSEGGRFMNQGYLTAWPERYESVHVIAHPGVNLAKWNVESHQLSWEGDNLRVDGRRLIMYHFSGLRRDDAGAWSMRGGGPLRVDPRFMKTVYQPYLRAVDAMQATLRAKGVEFIAPDPIVEV